MPGEISRKEALFGGLSKKKRCLSGRLSRFPRERLFPKKKRRAVRLEPSTFLYDRASFLLILP